MEIKITDSLVSDLVMIIYRLVLGLIIAIVAAWLYSVPIEHIIIGITVTYLTEIFILIDEIYR